MGTLGMRLPPRGPDRKICPQSGYVLVRDRDHRRAHGNQIREHILVAERALGRPIPRKHPVHHVNGDPADNRPSNLVICEDQGYHMLIHRRTRALAACGHADWLICTICHRYDAPENLSVGKKRGARHRACHADREVARARAAGRPAGLRWSRAGVERGSNPPRGHKTHCKHGHPLVGDNLKVDRLGHRACVTCKREAGRRNDLRRRAAS